MTNPQPIRHHRRDFAALAAFVALAGLLSACSSTSNGKGTAGGTTGSTTATSGTPTTSTSAPAAPKPVPVHVGLNIGDGGSVGVGMPIIATFPKKITDGKAFQNATKVYVCQNSTDTCSASNGQSVDAHWYFEYSDPASGHVMEAHLRLKNYWPAHSSIHVDLPVKGLSAGTVPRTAGHEQYAFQDNLTLDFFTTASHIVTVDDSTHTLTVMNDGQPWGKTFPVSLGEYPQTPTRHGTKVIMEKLPTVCMHDIAGTYYECGIKNDQRLTYDGEYLHAAPWNCTGSPGCSGPANNIGYADSSNGCTNLTPSDAVTLYNFLGVGDVVLYPNANGKKMQMGDGYGDWNVTWELWLTGGAIPTK